MSTVRPPGPTWHDDLPDLEELLERFDAAWRSGAAPTIEAFLPPAAGTGPGDTVRNELLQELIKIDLEYRWRRLAGPPTVRDDGAPSTPRAASSSGPRLEDYVLRYPELGPPGSLPVGLIGEEYRARRCWGDRPGHAEYAARFAGHGPDLQEMLARIDAELATDPPGERSARPTLRQPSAIPCPHCRGPIEQPVGPRPATLRCPACDGTFSLDDSPAGAGNGVSPPFSQVGRYELRDFLGSGAFGSVWRGWDTELRREVAVKLPRRDRFSNPAEEERFLREARFAARLRHPGIIAVHDVGRDQDTVYIVSELVRGQSLEQWLKGQRPGFRVAAELAARLAETLDHAHRQGVVHRDLKPSNVMLEQEPAPPNGARVEPVPLPRVMDFGLAKRDAGEVRVTLDGQVVGTPAYMSPEQVRRPHAVDGRGDIYSLGVVLYELLTGELPFRGTMTAVLMQVVTDEPRPPRGLNERVPRDLETICLKCLAKEPARRYATAGELAADLRRWLAGEPIHARPVGPVERLWRWCRRKPAMAILAAALVLAVVAGFASVTGLWRVADANARQERLQRERADTNAAKEKRERERAEANLLKNRQVVYLQNVLVSEIELRAESGAQPLQQRLLEQALAFFQDFLQQRPDDPALRTDVAEAHFRVALITSKIGKTDQALEKYLQARDLFEELVRERLGDARLRGNLAACWNNIGVLQQRTGQRAEAQTAYKRARDGWQALLKDHPDRLEFQKGLAKSHNHLGRLLHEAGRRDAALRSHEAAREIQEKLASAHPAVVAFQADLAGTYGRFALLKHETGDPNGALHWHTQALNIWRKLANDHPANPDLWYDLAAGHDNVARTYKALGQWPKALDGYQQALAIHRKLVRTNPAVNYYQRSLANSLNELGLLLDGMGKLPEALESLQEALAIKEKLSQADPANVELLGDLAAGRGNVGLVLLHSKQFDRAMQSYRAALPLWEKLVAAHPALASHQSALALCHNQIGIINREKGDLDGAMKSYEMACDLRAQLVRDHPDVPLYQSDLAGSYHNIARLHRQDKRPDEALTAHQTARAMREALVKAYPRIVQYRNELASSWLELGLLLEEMRRLDEAVASLRQTVHHSRIRLEQTPEVRRYREYLTTNLAHLARVLCLSGRHAEAIAALLELKELWPGNPKLIYGAVQELAKCIPLVGKDKTDLTAEEQAQRRLYADQAMDALREAVGCGFKDVERLRKDRFLDPLRPRDDFQKLLAGLEEGAKQ